MKKAGLPFPDQAAWLRWGLLAATLALFAYSALRAAMLSLTFDEVWSYTSYAQASWSEIFAYKDAAANNHLLNSLLMKASLGTFGLSEFSLRLPNVLAHGLYLYFTLRLLRHVRSPLLLVTGFVLLNLDPYVLDFFSLARGYGLAMAATMGMLSGMAAYFQEARTRHLLAALGWAALAVLANFSMLHMYLAALFVLGLASLMRTWQDQPNLRSRLRQFLPRAAGALLISGLLALVIAGPIQQLTAGKQLYYGGKTGLWTDTVTSSVYNLIYKVDYWKYDVLALKYLVGGSLLLMLAIFAYRALQRGAQPRSNPGLYFLLLLLLPAISTTAQHYLTGGNYLIDRTALFFHPLFLLALFYAINGLMEFKPLRIPGLVLAGLLTCLMLLNANHTLNLHHTAEWRYDACTKAMLTDLEALHAAQPEATIKLGISWQFRLSINFYREKNKIDWLAPVTAKGCAGEYDYYYILGNGKGCKLPKEKMPFWEQENRKVRYHYSRCNTRLGTPDPELTISER